MNFPNPHSREITTVEFLIGSFLLAYIIARFVLIMTNINPIRYSVRLHTRHLDLLYWLKSMLIRFSEVITPKIDCYAKHVR